MDYRPIAAIAAIVGCALALHAGGARAATVYECRGSDGSIAFQDRPCAGGQRERAIELAPAPPAAPSPEYAVPKPAVTQVRGAKAAPKAAVSHECRAANGEVFYRHSRCPASIRVRNGGAMRSIDVDATVLPRREACRRMRSARSGRERDETVSTYERNAGRDPCRRS